jgi:hypothetical protein
VRTAGLRATVLLLALFLLTSSTYAWRPGVQAHLAGATAGYGWDLGGWTVDALGEKVVEAVRRPARGYSDAQGAAFVTAFMARARAIGDLEREIQRLTAERDAAATAGASAPPPASAETLEALAAELAALRAMQEGERPTAEAIIEGQVSSVLVDMGLGVGGRLWPPVLFTFTESPAKVVVSTRDRIGTAAAKMIAPGLPIETVAEIEATIEANAQEAGGVSAYVAPTGGLGAFPTLVVNRGNLEWILSTVAHEWVHTYLAFFPLGFNYGRTPDNTLINETVAEIVGNEVGLRVLQRYYPDQAPPELPDVSEEVVPMPPADEPGAFDFEAEMRQTRESLDKLLSVGRIEDAEQYLEIRRLWFVENGYPIRKLNQAYFAFHGSYGTSAAASTQVTGIGPVQALGPLVEQVRAALPDAPTFLRTVRSVVDRAGVERLVEDLGITLPELLPETSPETRPGALP